LDSLASAEMEKQIEKTVSQIIVRADNMEDKTGIPSSMTENEAKTYLEEVLKEVRELKKK
jgi:transcription initiation factor TFIIIB Brf1 subunit/transcription initiation factor TFIIB